MKVLFKLLTFILITLCLHNFCFTQNYKGGVGLFSPNSMFEEEGGITYVGITFGRSHREISSLPGTLGLLFSPDSTYNFQSSYLPMYHLGITSMYGIQNTDAYLLFEAEYSMPYLPEDPFDQAQGKYEDYEIRNDDVVDSLQYALNFDYQQIHLRFGMGGFIKHYLSIQAGFDWAINTTPDRITYDSNDKTVPGRDLAIRDELQDKLKGKNDFGAFFGLGINIPLPMYDGYYDWMIFFNANYKVGFSDVIRTQSNNFRLQERQNRAQALHVNAGFRIAI